MMLKLRQILFVKVRPHNELYFRLIPSNHKCSMLAMLPFVFMKFAIPQVAKISARSTLCRYSHWEFQDCLLALVIIISHLSMPSILIPVASADALIYLSSPINLTKTFRSLKEIFITIRHLIFLNWRCLVFFPDIFFILLNSNRPVHYSFNL